MTRHLGALLRSPATSGRGDDGDDSGRYVPGRLFPPDAGVPKHGQRGRT